MATNPSAIPVASGSDMASLPAVWAYILPALDHIMRSHSDSLEAPPLDVNYHMGVYTVVYNFATASRAEKNGGRSGMLSHGLNLGLDLAGDDDDAFANEDLSKDWHIGRVERIKSMVGYELYGYLEDYFRKVAREVRTKAPHDDSALLTYYLASYTRYASGVAIVNRLFAYLNRHFITRAVDEGMGWISLQDVLKEKRTGKKTKKDIELLEARKREALKQWGYDGGTNEQRRFAEACAEAGSPPERIIPVASLAHRCWRAEVIEPFTSSGVPKAALESVNGADRDPSQKPVPTEPPVTSTPPISTNGTTPNPGSPSPTVTETLTPKHSKKNKKKKKNGKDRGKLRDEDSGSLDGAVEAANPLSTSTRSPSPSPLRSPAPSQSPLPQPLPKGRLNRVVGDLILTSGPGAAHAREMAVRLSRSLKASGVSPDNIIRKRLDKFLKR